MTNEEAIRYFKRHIDLISREAEEMAIKALEQQPCDDAISRDFRIGDEVRIIGSDPIYDDCDVGWVIRNASEKVKTMYVMRNDGSADEEAKAEWYKTGRHNAMLAEVIKALPSVTQKSGKWIPVSEKLPEDKTYVLTTIKVPNRIAHARSSWYECGFFHNDNGDTWRATDMEVKAWMPLPEPYKDMRGDTDADSD